MLSLTGLPLRVLACLLAAGGFAATLWLWPRLSGRGVRAWLGRIAAFLGTQAAAFAAVGLVGNAYFGFYSSWSDLLGTGGGPGTVVDHRPGGQDALSLTGRRKVWSTQGSAADRSGLIERIRIRSTAAGPDGALAYVYLPPEYFRPAYARSRFPMALVLSGYPGSAEKLISLLEYPDSALEAVRAGLLPPTVLVMMRPALTGPRDTECMDIPGGPQVETFFTEELPRAMGAAYRVLDRPEARAVLGDSTGGYCALKFALRRPDSYRAAVSLSGYYAAASDPTTGDLFGGRPHLERENDLLWRLRTLPAPPVSLLLAATREEHTYAATRQMAAAFRSPTRLSTITLDGGGHNFRTWTREIPPALAWLGRRLTPPQPVDDG